MKTNKIFKTREITFLIGLFFVFCIASCVNPHYRQDNTHEPPGKFEPIPVERANGFYSLASYSPESGHSDIELEAEPAITPKDIKEIRKTTRYFGTWSELELQLTEEGTRKLYLLTKANIGHPIAFVVENQIVAMPMVMAAVVNGRASIAGGYPEEELDRIIEILKEGQ
jgi:preprotein translocase subunit SecD